MAEMKTYEPHPLCLCVPPNSDAKRRAILESIKADPTNVVVTLYEGKILDGRTRYELCTEAGIEFATEKFDGTRAEAAKYVADQLRPRRDLSATQRAEAIERLCESSSEYQEWIAGLKTQADENVNSGKAVDQKVDVISAKASAAGVSRSTQAQTQKARRDKGVADKMLSGEVSAKQAANPSPPVDKGVDGKKTHDSVGSGKKKVTGGTAFNVDELTDSPLVDGEGNPIPEPLEPVFREVDKFKKVLQDISAARSLLKKVIDGPASNLLPNDSAVRDLSNAYRTVTFATPHVPCPRKKLKHDGCNVCKGRGWINYELHKEIAAGEGAK